MLSRFIPQRSLPNLPVEQHLHILPLIEKRGLQKTGGFADFESRKSGKQGDKAAFFHF
jgi:hypothetical protein